jgi:hypothetical protein
MLGKTIRQALHETCGGVERRPRATLLPLDLFERFSKDGAWLRPQPRLAHFPKVVRIDWNSRRTAARASP